MAMEKKAVFAAILVALISSVHSKYYSETQLYEQPKLQTTKLKFYLHDTLSGKNPTAVQIAGPSARVGSGPTSFGTLFAIDDPLTEGPEITSKVIGNARGMYVSSSKGQDLTLVLYIDLGFTDGRFNGSSLSVFSRNPITETHREIAIVGGRGLFRRASGTVFVTTQSLNFKNGDAVLEYNVEVVHP